MDDDIAACDAVAAQREDEKEEGCSSKKFDRKPSLWFKRWSVKSPKDERERDRDKDKGTPPVPAIASSSLSTPFSFSSSFSAASSLPLMNREGTGGTGGASTPGLGGVTIPSAADGRIFELLGEVRREERPPCVRTGGVGEAVVESEVSGIRIVGSDLRVGRGRASEGMSGGEIREGDKGAFSIGGRDCAGVTVGASVGTCGYPNPGGRAGSGKSGITPPLTSGMPETTTSDTTGGVGGLSPSEARSRSTA